MAAIRKLFKPEQMANLLREIEVLKPMWSWSWSCPILTDSFFMESRKFRLVKAD